MEPDVVSCGVVVFRETPVKSFLLMKHADRWDFPKGKVDPGETELECALRELQEETGICEQHIDIDPEFRFVLPYTVGAAGEDAEPKSKHLIMFLGKVTDNPEIRLTEHIGYEWRTWSPPHRIQARTIDPTLQRVANYFASSGRALNR